MPSSAKGADESIAGPSFSCCLEDQRSEVGICVRTNVNELRRARIAAHDHVIVDPAVAREGHVVRHDDVAADDAVMPDVHADHQQAVVADAGDHAAAHCARIDSHVLADRRVAADLEPRQLALILEILRPVPDRSEGKDRRSAGRYWSGR